MIRYGTSEHPEWAYRRGRSSAGRDPYAPEVTGRHLDRVEPMRQRVLLALAECDLPWASVPDIAWFSGLNQHSVRRTLEQLVSEGAVEEGQDHAHPHGRAARLYRLSP